MRPVLRNRDSSVGIETGYGLDGRGSILGRGKIFLCSTASTAHPDPYTMDNGAISPGVKWPGREAEQSRESYEEVNKFRNYTSTPSYSLIKHMDIFYNQY
jgi:hypothetical protein